MSVEAAAGSKLRETTSICTVCKRVVAADVVELDGAIVMRKTCPEHGPNEVTVASDAGWYHRAMSRQAELVPPGTTATETRNGCPFDCGACPGHEQRTYLPVVPITSACNLNCPICYTINRNKDAFHMPLDEFARILDIIRRNDPHLKIINFTGGEPTLHPEMTRIIRMCHEAGIHRITISTHGLAFVGNEEMLAELAELNARIVLSFNSFDDDVNERMMGLRVLERKMRVLDLLEKHDVDTTIIPVVAKGLNDNEIGRLVELALGRDFIRSLEIHTMTFTGQGGLDFDPAARLTTSEVLHRIEEATDGRIAMSDFTPSPCAHPLCYQTCYLLATEREPVPFARFMSEDTVRFLLASSLYMEPGERMESVLQDAVADLWATEGEGEMERAVLGAVKKLIQDLLPSRRIEYREQQRIAERAGKTIYIHSHMDDETFDTDRIRQCCVGVPYGDGSFVPTCSYNILYRGRDGRFSTRDLPPISSLAGGLGR